MAGWQIQIIQATTITSDRCGLHLKMGLLVQSSLFLCDLTSWLEYRLPHCFSSVFSSANCSGRVCVYMGVHTAHTHTAPGRNRHGLHPSQYISTPSLVLLNPSPGYPACSSAARLLATIKMGRNHQFYEQ